MALTGIGLDHPRGVFMRTAEGEMAIPFWQIPLRRRLNAFGPLSSCSCCAFNACRCAWVKAAAGRSKATAPLRTPTMRGKWARAISTWCRLCARTACTRLAGRVPARDVAKFDFDE